jgi:hypothetical protein
VVSTSQDRVQGVLELNDDADSGKQQGADPDDGRDHAFARPVGAFEHGFDGLLARRKSPSSRQ